MTYASASSPVRFETRVTSDGHHLGIVWLNQPELLNALSLEMARDIHNQLIAWESDPMIVLVIFRGVGEKAFCAGGDLQSIYKSLPASPTNQGWSNHYLKTFFQVEYTLDYHIHNYSKPVLCWANGIVMGGGAGLMMGASHRVGTPATRFAMPETTIGLFPDVGATWLLGRMPVGVGRFLAMTGASIGVSDAHCLGVLDYVVPAGAWPTLLETLESSAWSGDRALDDSVLSHCLESLQGSMPDTGPIQRHMSAMALWCAGTDWRKVHQRLLSLVSHDDPWLAQAASRLQRACPTMVALAFEMLRRGQHLSLAQIFQLEYVVALNGTARRDFREGIRALLIEKTNDPDWSPATSGDVDPMLINSFFIPPWPDTIAHPLAPLG